MTVGWSGLFFWWSGWILMCVPAGTLAGVGLIEFNWGGLPYDVGFMGYLVLFGGFLAFGQAPFVAVFVWSLVRGVGAQSWRRYTAVVTVAVAWPMAGLFGWTFGSFVEVSLSDIFLYSHSSVAARSVRWLVVGVAEGFILAAVLPAPSWRRDAGRVALLGLCAAWAGVSVVGGLLVESWAALEFVVRSNEINQAIGEFLEDLGVAENVARVVFPYALFVPLLYGVPSGWVFPLIRLTVARDQR